MTEQPDIIFITTDTQGREMLGCYGERPGVDTPHLDRLATEGIRFANAFTTCPLCTPARSSWYTGLHPCRSGAWANGQSPHRNVPMLGNMLVDAGYDAEHIGKWHLDGIGYYETGSADGGFNPDVWYDIGAFLDEVGRDGPNRFGAWNRGFEDVAFTLARHVGDRAIGQLRQAHSRPLFLAVEFDEPHGPYICPPPFRDHHSPDDVYHPPALEADLSEKPGLQQEMSAHLREARPDGGGLPPYYARYYSCNSFVDAEIGRVLDAVATHRPDATVIFTSDHGDHLGAFGLGPKGPTMYDLTTGVPLIVKGPDITPRVEEGLVSSVDVWATVADLAGLGRDTTSGPEYTGRTLRPAMDGAPIDRDAAFVEYNRFGVPQDACGGFYPIRCVRTRDWKLSVNLSDRDELYNLAEDPHERVNRIDDRALASVRNELHDRLLDWQARTRDPFRGSAWVDRPWRPETATASEALFPTGYRDAWPSGPFNGASS